MDVLDLSSVASPQELHALLAQHFRFPDYYGRNWDAFWDCITDPEVIQQPIEVRVFGLDLLKMRLPDDAANFEAISRDLEAQQSAARIVFVTALH